MLGYIQVEEPDFIPAEQFEKQLEQRPPTARCTKDEQFMTIVVSDSAAKMLLQISKAIEAGQSITIIPTDGQLSLEQAADILNVSRQYAAKLVHEGKIPYTEVNGLRLVHLADVKAYKKEVVRKRKAVLDLLVADAQEQGGMGYEKCAVE